MRKRCCLRGGSGCANLVGVSIFGIKGFAPMSGHCCHWDGSELPNGRLGSPAACSALAIRRNITSYLALGRTGYYLLRRRLAEPKPGAAWPRNGCREAWTVFAEVSSCIVQEGILIAMLTCLYDETEKRLNMLLALQAKAPTNL